MQVLNRHHPCHTCACPRCPCNQSGERQCTITSAACYCLHDCNWYVQTAAASQPGTGAGHRVEHCAAVSCRIAQLQHCSAHYCARKWTVHQVISVWCPFCACSGRGDLHNGVTTASGCCRIAPVNSLAALQHLRPQQAPCSGPQNAESLFQSCETARSSGALPTFAAAFRRLIHGRAAIAEPATSAASAATRHPLPAFTADEGLTAAAAEAAQVEVATADSPAAAHPDTATDGFVSGHRASTAGADTPATRPPTAAGRRKSAKRTPAAKASKRASVGGNDPPREWRPNSRLPPVDYTPAVEAEVLAFWRRRGLLLPEAAVADAAAAGEQRLLRRRVLRFAQKSSHHRDVPQLEQRLARWDAAKAEMQCVSTFALASFLSMCHYHNISMLFCLLGSRQCPAHRRGH